MTIDETARKRLEQALLKKLSPEEITGNLLGAGLFLVVYELLKTEILENTRTFFTFGFDESGPKVADEYNTKVLSLDRSPFRASCLWLEASGAISSADVEVAGRIREHRNAVAHELPRFIVDTTARIDLSLFAEAHRLLQALGRFWGRIEVDTNPDFDGKDVLDEDIKSGSMLLMEHILSVTGLRDAQPTGSEN